MTSEKNKSDNIKGIKLRTLTLSVISVLIVLCVIFVISINRVRNGYEGLSGAYEDCIRYRKDAQWLKEGSYYLTEQVHLFTVTGEKQHADNYFEEVNVSRRRDSAVDDLRQTAVITSAQQSLIDALEQSEELRKREIYAIRLAAEAIAQDNGVYVKSYLDTYDPAVAKCELSQKDRALSAEEKRILAKEIVFDDEYIKFRNSIDSNIQTFLDETYQLTVRTKDGTVQVMKKNTKEQCILVVLLLLLTAIESVCINLLVLRPLKIYMKCVREGRTFELLGAYEFKNLALTYDNIFEVQHENEKMLRQKAEHDPLTGLLNKGAYNRISAQYLEREINIAVLIIDIDNFKGVNDNYGHAIGDMVIKSVGELLLNSFRPSDIVARIGGDEFSVVMLDISHESAENIGIKIRHLNETLQKPTSDLPKTSLSVGAAFSEYGFSEELFKLADEALYETKRKGKCGFSYNEKVYKKPEEPEKQAPAKKSKKKK